MASDEGVEEWEATSEWWRAKAFARWRRPRRGFGGLFSSSRHSFSMSVDVIRWLGKGLGRIEAGGVGWRLGEAEADVARALSRDRVSTGDGAGGYGEGDHEEGGGGTPGAVRHVPALPKTKLNGFSSNAGEGSRAPPTPPPNDPDR